MVAMHSVNLEISPIALMCHADSHEKYNNKIYNRVPTTYVWMTKMTFIVSVLNFVVNIKRFSTFIATEWKHLNV
jgi:hypothetical protein